MASKAAGKPVCQICGSTHNEGSLVPAAVIRPGIVAVIRESFPAWRETGHICLNDLNQFRARYVERLLQTERGDLSDLDHEVVAAMQRHELISEHPDAEFEEQLTVGQRLSDRMASFGGSWTFIIIFGTVLLLWITANAAVLLWRPFDPYPFILLNLILSCLAAIQAPIIMMSQNRQEAKDRLRAEHDYQINLKAELEIRHLHEKMDHLLKYQWERLVEIQQVQMEILSEFRREESGSKNA
jgi:uncharacterized membrane protein